MNRRRFIQCLAASAAAVASGIPARMDLPPAETEGVWLTAAESTAVEYGYSFDGMEWTDGFASRTAALAEARRLATDREMTVRIARTSRIDFAAGDDLADCMAEAIGNGDAPMSSLVTCLMGSNEDGDAWGELEDHMVASIDAPVETAVRTAMAEALARLGFDQAAAAYRDGDDHAMFGLVDDDLRETIAGDAVLERDLATAIAEWAARHDFTAVMSGIACDEMATIDLAPAMAAELAEVEEVAVPAAEIGLL